MHVAVCIVGFRNPDDVVGCLHSLSCSEHTNFEVMICENGGEQAFLDLGRALPPTLPGGQAVRVVLGPGNVGYAGGINICMRETSGADAWWILNPDTLPSESALALMCARLQRADCGAVGSTVHTADGMVQSRGGQWRAWLARVASLDHHRHRSDPPSAEAVGERVSYLSGASMLVGRELVDQVGYMREDYFLYGEEVEWCLRAVQDGIRLGLALDADVLHKEGTTTGSVSDVAQRRRLPVFLDERNKILITRDRFPARLPVAAVAALMLVFLRFGRRGAWRQLGFALAGWWAGLLNRRGKPDWIEAAR